MNYLLDTCILSEYVKKKPNEQVIKWLDDQDKARFFISILTIAELKKGIIKMKDSQPSRYHKLEKWLNTIEQEFAERILPLNKNIFDIWAKHCGESEAKGQTLPIMDSLIAATAYEYNLIIVTRNVKDFNFSSIKVFSPWDSLTENSNLE
jgi:predicted nucleic acid-binding protein